MALQTKLADELADFRHFWSVRYNKFGKGVKDGLTGCGKTPPSVANNQNVPIAAHIGQLLERIFMTISRFLKKIPLLAEAATTRGSFQIDFSAAC